jgi:hypothetical protein
VTAVDLPVDATPWALVEDEADRLLAELTRATGGDPAVELAPRRDEQAVLDGLLAMISDLGGGEAQPPPQVEADQLLRQLEDLTG